MKRLQMRVAAMQAVNAAALQPDSCAGARSLCSGVPANISYLQVAAVHISSIVVAWRTVNLVRADHD